MITLVLLAQLTMIATPPAAAPRDSATYSNDAVRALVTEAARLNGLVPPSLGRYHATLESEISFGSRLGDSEMAVSIEQMASDLTWARTGDFEQHVTGYRSQSAGMQFATLGFFRYPWAVPSLYGNRLALLFGRDTARRAPPAGRGAAPPGGARGGGGAGGAARGGGARGGAGPGGVTGAVVFPPRPPGERVTGERSPQGTTYAVHPLATDRERVYRYSGGDTVENLKVGDRVIRIVRIDVTAKDPLPPRTTVFVGEIDLDLERKHVVRMRGTFATTAERPRGPLGVLNATQLEGAIFVELVNSEVNQQYWLPMYQRFDFQATFATFGEQKQVFRIISRFRDYAITLPESTATIAATDSLRPRPHLLTVASKDSLAAFTRWREEIGTATARASTEDFADVAPARWRADGPPMVRVQTERLSDALRFNRVEGLFTGLGVSARMRDAAPGLTLRTVAGYAWSERAVRGRASAELDRGPTTWTLRAGRSLDITNDFRPPFDSGTSIGPIFGTDDNDYVDRYSAGGAVLRTFGRRRVLARVELGWAEDRAPGVHVKRGVLGGTPFLPNRGVTEGSYARTAFALQWNPDLSAEFMRPGAGAQLSYLRGDGALAFQRVEVRFNARRNAGRWTFASRLDAGAVLGTPPPQQLFELGGEHNLPGYDYKEFAGDQAALVRGIAMYRLGVLSAPIRVTRMIWLPALAPALSFSLQSGWTGVSGAAARAAMTALGPRHVMDASSAAAYAPASVPTGSARTTVAFGLRAFGGAAGLVFARAVDRAGPWKLRVEFGNGF
jgi:hypothetical protein